MSAGINTDGLVAENLKYKDSAGISENNGSFGFTPAYLDRRTGQIELSRYANGSLAPIHILEGLPDNWVSQRDVSGRITAIKSTIVSGFLREGQFFTRDQAVQHFESVLDW